MRKKSTYNPEANRRWAEKNRERRSYLSSRSSARSFIRNHATAGDLNELEDIIVTTRKKKYK